MFRYEDKKEECVSYREENTNMLNNFQSRPYHNEKIPTKKVILHQCLIFNRC